jgi:heme/copper-type cytochrome/quinol oxidase subunit 2
MLKTSHIAGYVTSLLAVIFVIFVAIFRSSGGDVPSWFTATVLIWWGATAISAVVCLVTGAFGFFRSRRQTQTDKA